MSPVTPPDDSTPARRRHEEVGELLAELQRMREGADPTPEDPAVWPTPGQWLYRLSQRDGPGRLAAARAHLDSAQAAERCLAMHHEAELAHLRETVARLTAQLGEAQ